MKKTFKRAGIAVLSMSMLLSMGAVTAISSSAAGETIAVAASTGFKASDKVDFYKVAVVDSSTGSWTWCSGLNDKIVGTIFQNVLAESNMAKNKVVLWDFHPVNSIDRLYYHVACLVSDIYNKDMYLEMKFFDYLKFKWKNKKRKNLHWVWRKHTSLPEDCKTSVYIIMDYVREYYKIPIETFDKILKEYYEDTDN